MSYDYNALVSAIASHRLEAKKDSTRLQQSVDTFSTLSTHCPMTPLLWIQYASDASQLIQVLLNKPDEALEMRLQTLELGMTEFPGCALLRLHYLEELLESSTKGDEEKRNAFEDALQNVGQGSHRNEGEIVASIYRLYAKYLASKKQHEKLLDMFARRAQTPMKDANDSLTDEFQQICQSNNISVPTEALQRMEEGRMWASKTFGGLATWEDDVDVAMNDEGILSRHEISLGDVDWDSLIQSEQGRFWMGLGGAKTANAFIKYARACAKYSSTAEDDDKEADEQQVRALALSIYERGVSECPTVESLWLAYLNHLTKLLSMKDATVASEKLQSVASRAVRNCPYSLALYQRKIEVLGILSELGQVVLDPDAVMAIVQEAVDAKFLPTQQSYLDLHLTAIRVVKCSIMNSVSKATSPTELHYDDAEPMGKVGPNSPPPTVYANLDDDTEQEVQDLVEDLREIYDTTDAYLRKNHSSWTQGRSVLWKDRAKTESFLLGPLMASLDDSHGDSEQSDGTDQEMIRCYEKLIRLHQPTHPDYFIDYIQSVLGNISVSMSGEVLARLRKVRGLYQKALVSVKKHHNKEQSLEPTQNTLFSSHRDPEIALHCLCYDYLDFEQCFGSKQSFTNASRSVEKKLHKAVSNGDRMSHDVVVSMSTDGAASTEQAVPNEKRKHANGPAEQPPSKKPKAAKDDKPPSAMEVDDSAEKKVNLKVPKLHPVHKVRIGELEYPAHPFTVRVSNLSIDTEDMDLVDLFKERCGPIVHARVLREKHHAHGGKGKSKGCALVQFEERDSVETALQLDGEVGLHEKLVKVERTHMHAAEVVPPGMHRVNPKGKGRSSKRNQFRKNQHTDASNRNKNADGTEGKGASQQTKEPKARSDNSRKQDAGILAFRPRGVAHGQAHRKMHLNLNDGKGGQDKDSTSK